jgi:hypothetical protein
MIVRSVEHKAWFVSYKSRSGSHHERVTHTFESEDEAKQFAIRMLIEEKYPIAGTLNPNQPKQIISSFQVASWASVD